MQGIRISLKKFLPKTLFGRALLILLLPILLLQAVVASMFVQRHYDAVTEQMAGSVARELSFAIARIETAATMAEARAALSEMTLSRRMRERCSCTVARPINPGRN
jgi:two-component system osmolarity sensor histidine kinase EnvZ